MKKYNEKNLRELLNHEITAEWLAKKLGTKEEVEAKFIKLLENSDDSAELKIDILDEMLDYII